MFQRRHYDKIAQVLATVYEWQSECVDPMVGEGTVVETCEELANMFAEDNDNFRRERFYDACGFDRKYLTPNG